MAKKYDVVVIGAGPAGYVAAIRLAQLGKSVCIVEPAKEHLGGVCLNEGCIPTKSLINSSEFLDIVKEATKAGVELKVQSPPDLRKMISSALNVSTQLRNGIAYLFSKNNIDLKIGRGSFLSKTSLLISNDAKEEQIEATNFIIATGSRPKILSGLEPDNKRIITSNGVFKLEALPKSLLIIGGGAIGIEYAALFRNLGSEVTIVELMDQLLPLEDSDIGQEVARYLKRKGIEILTQSQVLKLERKGGLCNVEIKTPASQVKKEFEYVLLSTGRSPNSENLGLEKLGIELEKGFIKVDENMRTNINNIYAIGDCINTPMLAHVASAEAIVAAEVIAAGKAEAIDYSCVPSVVYLPFQVGSVGLTENCAKDKGLNISISKHFFRSCPKAVLLGKPEGFIKIIIEKNSGKIIGVHIVGHQASELIHEFVLAKRNGLRVQDIANTIHAHPTLSEIAVDAAKAAFDKPIHG